MNDIQQGAAEAFALIAIHLVISDMQYAVYAIVAQRFQFRFSDTSQGDSRHLIRLAQLSQNPLGFGFDTTPANIGFAILSDIEAFFVIQAAQADN